MFLFTVLGVIGFGILGIKDYYDTCNINDERRQNAIEDGNDFYYGRRGEKYDVVSGKKCRIQKLPNGDANIVELSSGKFIRKLSEPKRMTEREKAFKENRVGYIADHYGDITRPRVKIETATDRIYSIDPNKDYIVYLKLYERRLTYDGIRAIPKSAIEYYRYPNTPVPADIMEQVIKYEERAGIYREQREKKED